MAELTVQTKMMFAALAKIEALETRVEALEALASHATHQAYCGAATSTVLKCTCGFTDALHAVKAVAR